MSKFTRAFGFFSLGLGISLLVGYWLKREERRHYPTVTEPLPDEPILVLSQQVLENAAPLTAAASSDNLTHIQGIGAKTAEALTQLGIHTYNQLANANPAELVTQLSNIRGLNEEKVARWIEHAAQLSAKQHD